MVVKPGWFRWVYLGMLIFTTILVGMWSISGNTTPAFEWYKSFLVVPWALFIVSWITELLINKPIMPLGDIDPETFPLQRILGYNGAFIASLVSGLGLFYFFRSLVITQQQAFIPAYRMFRTTLQTKPGTLLSVLSGGSAKARAFGDGLLPSMIENPYFIYIEAMALFFLIRFIFLLSGFLPELYATISAGIFAAFGSAIIFPKVFHIFAYGEVAPAYWRAFFIVFLCMIPVMLTGFPIPMFLGHFANNYYASLESLIVVGALIIPAFIVLNRNQIANYLSQNTIGGFYGK